jgi:hypothetical protein
MAEEYFKLFFDAKGYQQDLASQAAVINALVSGPKPVTDLWVFAYGWDNDLVGGTNTYNTWVSHMWEVQKEKVIDPTYNPLFVGIFWPSKAWDGTIMKRVASAPASSGREATTGGGIGEFEMGGDLLAPPPQPLAEPGTATDIEKKNRFVAGFRPIMDPEGIYGGDYERDFSRLYTLMSRPEPPTDKEIREFVKILKKYETPDPHDESIERQNIGSVPVDVVVNQLKEAQAARSLGYESLSALGVLQKLFGVFSFWKMKGRAAIVGENGVYRFLVDVKKALGQHRQRTRIHLLGHSFGAKLVTAAVYPAASAQNVERPLVDTLILLLGAFSQFSFSSAIPVEIGSSGHYAPILERGVIANPVVVIYSRYDMANTDFYPFGMLFAAPAQRYEMSGLVGTGETYNPSKNPFGAIGANGAQGLDATRYRAIDILPRNQIYQWGDLTGISCLNVDGQQFISHGSPPAGAHNDINSYEIFYLALAMSLRRPNIDLRE